MTEHIRGFSFIEVLISVALLTLIGSIGLVAGLDSFRGTLLRNDREVLYSALAHARSKALYGICAGNGCKGPVAHGVFVTRSGYVVFEGSSYSGRDGAEDEILESEPHSAPFIGREVVFSAFSTQVASTTHFVFRDANGRNSTTTINSEGGIIETP